MTVYFRVKNWERFQHYKDRAPPWIKLHREILSSRTWVMLDDNSKALAIACMLLAADTDNKVPADPAYIKRVAYLQTTPDLAPLVETDFIELIDENGNVLAPASECLQTAPQRRGEESRAEHIRPSDVAADAARELEKQILDAYHELLPDLPAVRDWSDRRKRKLAARIRERVKAGKPAGDIAYWRQLFAKVAASDFLCGRKTDWRCSGLEWLLEPKNFTKLIEGSYDNTGGTHGRSYAAAGSAALS